MAGFEKEIVVNAPPDKVFSYLADFTRHHEWTAQPVRIEQTSQGPVGRDTTFSSRNRFMGRDLEDKLIVTEFVPNQRLVYDGDGDTGGFRHVLQVQPANGGTRIYERHRDAVAHTPRQAPGAPLPDHRPARARRRPEAHQVARGVGEGSPS